jgi:methyl-accepting chemotaxis protein
MIASTLEQAEKARAIANGDLTTEITVRSEFDVLGKALAGLVERFNQLAASIVSSAEQVDSGAKLVANSSMALSQGAAEQAGSVEELTASLEQITSQTSLNAGSASEASELTSGIRTAAEAGNGRMAEMLRAMEEINASSDNIGKIIKVSKTSRFRRISWLSTPRGRGGQSRAARQGFCRCGGGQKSKPSRGNRRRRPTKRPK